MENIIEVPIPKYNYISAKEYLRVERTAVEKHEYYNGEIFALSGASLGHHTLFKLIWINCSYISISLKAIYLHLTF